jgi:hypothetical protein
MTIMPDLVVIYQLVEILKGGLHDLALLEEKRLNTWVEPPERQAASSLPVANRPSIHTGKWSSLFWGKKSSTVKAVVRIFSTNFMEQNGPLGTNHRRVSQFSPFMKPEG